MIRLAPLPIRPQVGMQAIIFGQNRCSDRRRKQLQGEVTDFGLLIFAAY